MRTSLPVRVERLWWVRRLRRLLRSLGTLPLVLDSHGQVLNAFRTSPGSLAIFAANYTWSHHVFDFYQCSLS